MVGTARCHVRAVYPEAQARKSVGAPNTNLSNGATRFRPLNAGGDFAARGLYHFLIARGFRKSSSSALNWIHTVPFWLNNESLIPPTTPADA